MSTSAGRSPAPSGGDGVVEDLAADLARRYPGVRGYTRRNLFRMQQFFEAYRAQKKVSPLVTQFYETTEFGEIVTTFMRGLATYEE